MNIYENQEQTKPYCRSILIKNIWDKDNDQSKMIRASFGIGAVGVDTLTDKGESQVQPNMPLDTSKLNQELLTELYTISVSIRKLYEEAINGYPSYVEPVEVEEPVEGEEL